MNRYLTLLVTAAILSVSPTTTYAGIGASLLKAAGKFMSKEGSETASRQLAKGISDEVADRVATKLLKEGGEEVVERAAKLTAEHGPDVVRALGNVADPIVVLKALDDLPIKANVPAAAARLAAGEGGKQLGELTTKYGSKMLAAEVKHPGIATAYAKSLGDEGIDLCSKLNKDQALDIGRHLDDITELPPELRRKLLSLADENPSGLAKYVREFTANNPKSVLFTVAATTLLLSQPETMLGGPDKPDGTPDPGFVQRFSDWLFDRTFRPILKAALWIGIPFVVIYAAWKLYKTWRIDSREIQDKTTPATRADKEDQQR